MATVLTPEGRTTTTRIRISKVSSESYSSACSSLCVDRTRTAFTVGYVMQGVADLLIAIVMLRSAVFSRTTAWLGITYGITALIPANAGTVGFVAGFLSRIPMVVWFVLVGRRDTQRRS